MGWDVNHDKQTNPYEQEVKVEPAVSASGQRRADYAFHLAPNYRNVRFFVEAKKPYGDIATADNYFQTIRYAWNSETPLAVVTDFKQFHVLDCRYRPDIATALNRHIARYCYREFADREKFAEIYWLFSREAVACGSLEKRAKELPKPRGKAVQRGLFPGGYQSIDEAFLEELDEYRLALARGFKNKNSELDGETLTEMVQRTLDRLVFIRFLEDKGIEPQRIVEHFGDKGTPWVDFVAASRRLDSVYNGIVFKRHDLLDGDSFQPDETVFADICERISHINSPYDFDAIPIHILGSIYERFLGNVIVATDKRARVEPKPEVRKAGGVYYTPEYIVRYIVENTVGKLIHGKTPDQIAEMRFADIACGSGSFLLGVYELLLAYHGQYYNENPKSARKGDCIVKDGKLYLSLSKKREILLNNIYGVDIDFQAVEVCQLSLFLRLLKDETTGSTHQHILDFAHIAKMKKLLPDLSKNIDCGNSLIGTDISQHRLFECVEEHKKSVEERKLNSMDFEDSFPGVMRRGGFDAIVGNPPYRMLQPHNTPADILSYLRSHFVAAEFKIDLFHMFLQRAVCLLQDGGYLSYIVPTTILNNVYAETLRKRLMSECCIEQIAVARGRVFAEADVHTSVLVLRREAEQKKREDQEVLTTDQLSPEFAETPSFQSCTRQSTFGSLPGQVWNILVNDNNSRLIHRMMSECISLDKLSKINRGLITGDRDKYFAKTKRTAKHEPILTGSDVHRYCTDSPSEFVLYKRPKSAGGCWDEEMHFAAHKLVVRQISEVPTAREPLIKSSTCTVLASNCM
ncbi:MAG: N-6 DNA methylase [Terracidiphilus sp.]